MPGGEDQGQQGAGDRVVATRLQEQRVARAREEAPSPPAPLEELVERQQENGQPADGQQVQMVDVAELVGAVRGEDPGADRAAAIPGEGEGQRVETPGSEREGDQDAEIEEQDGVVHERGERDEEDGRAERQIGVQDRARVRVEDVAVEQLSRRRHVPREPVLDPQMVERIGAHEDALAEARHEWTHRRQRDGPEPCQNGRLPEKSSRRSWWAHGRGIHVGPYNSRDALAATVSVHRRRSGLLRRARG